ncbi:MAG: aryl-sulfate sulfotransferase [Ignavibacteriaceae bacterium]
MLNYKRVCHIKLILTALFIFISVEALTQEKPSLITFIHPKPGAEYVTPQSGILIKFSNNYKNNLKSSDFHFSVFGEKSGLHNGETIVSDNTIIFKPSSIFKTSEKIFVSFIARLTDWNDSLKFSFTTSYINEFEPEIFLSVSDDEKFFKQLQNSKSDLETKGEVTTINGVSVPSDFPHFEPDILNNGIAEGRIFLNNWQGSPYIMILENDGTPYFYQRVEERARDFKVQPNGLLTRRYIADLYGFVGMDSNYTVIDTFLCANSYGTDEHEIYMLEDGHYFLIALGYRQVDMSVIVSGGDPNATVIDNHVQEFDADHNLVFEWLSYDYFNIIDAVHEDLTQHTIDYIHMNSIAVDYDGNIIISSRHLSEVTKINRQTGEIIWHLGGENNDFAFINDNFGISYQHFARPVEGKPNHYTIFDNGNYHNPHFSRAVEFQLDTLNKTASKVWEYRHASDRYTPWMGNAQRLPNGNTLINYADGSLPKATEVSESGEIVYEGNFVNYTHCYRTYRFEWESIVDKPYLIVEAYPTNVTLIYNKFGDNTIEKYVVFAGLDENSLIPVDTAYNTFIELTELENHTRYYFGITAIDSSGNESQISNIENVLVNFTPPSENYLVNGDFSNGDANWIFNVFNPADASGGVNSSEEYEININNGGSERWHIQLSQNNIPLIMGRTYQFEFDARATAQRVVDAKLERNGPPYENYSQNGPSLVTTQMQHYSFQFEMQHPSDYETRVIFNCGADSNDLYFDNISLKEIVTSIVEETDIIFTEHSLNNNYPNPFNPTTNISFSITDNGFTILKIYDVLGNEIATLINSELSPGKYNVEFSAIGGSSSGGNATSLPSGIYFYRLSVNNFTITKKMVLLK